MKNSILILFCFLFPVLLSAQKKKKEYFAKVFIGGEVGRYSSGLIVEKDFEWLTFKADRMKWKRGKGRSYGITLGFAINPQIDLLTGFTTHNFTLVQQNGFNFWRCDPSAYGALSIVSVDRLVYLQSFELPLEARYKFRFNKLFVYPSVGIKSIFYEQKRQEVDMLLDNDLVVDHYLNDTELEHNRKNNFASVARLGLAYKVLERWKLKTELFHQYHFGKDELLTDNVRANTSSFGISAGIEYALQFERLKKKRKRKKR